ncbi:hypothetical protein [uncultured Dysosmobacter sp.]|uniref:hypothetical protein n=1 Tax=uncultured Dysosmobacter sp. TaxID=2591384 RepID=UPI0026130E11|nr:hypothetical protein [uncultured Dysosmobacter sp.]
MDFHHRRLRRRAAYAAPIKQENCFICDSYQTLYLYLFNGITDVLALLEAQNYGQADCIAAGGGRAVHQRGMKNHGGNPPWFLF